MTDMVSPYLERPVRTLDRALEDRVLVNRNLVPPEAPRPASAAPLGLPAGSNPDSEARRLDPVGVLVRLLMSGLEAEGGDETVPAEAPAEAPAASQPSGRRAA